MPSITYKTTGFLIQTLEKIFRVQITIDGLENLDDTPTLFVVNHFTRMETFIIPYLLHKHAGLEVRSLADASLFKGLFGRYLENMGTLSTEEPMRNRMILGDLITGRSQWVIYPEGIMVKNKKVITRGKFHLQTPNINRAPRTGAAVLALKSEIVKRKYLEAHERGDEQTISRMERRYGLSGIESVVRRNTVIVPVNITYYPFRPDENILSRFASALFKNVPERIEEELQVEGGILFQDTDMNIYFDRPIPVKAYLDKPFRVAHHFFPFIDETKRNNVILWVQRNRLTQAFMRIIYQRVAIHIDHLFCTGLREFKGESVVEEDFKRCIYLTVLELKIIENRRLHRTLVKDFINLISDDTHEPYDDIRRFASKEGLIHCDKNVCVVHHEVLGEIHSFHRIRLENPLHVIANELEPLKGVTKLVRKNVNLSRDKLRKELFKKLLEEDLNCFVKEHETYYKEGVSKLPGVGRPFLLRSKNRQVGFVLCHGFLSAPAEMHEMANFLNALGYPVYVVRMQGHGTSPRNLVDVTFEDWVHSFNRGYAIMRQYVDRIIVGGFSSGGLLALLAVARKTGPIDSVFCVNTPLVISDIRTRLIPAYKLWNELLDAFNFEKGKFEYVENASESPDINYDRIYLNGVAELNKMINACRQHLEEIKAPALVVQASEDPVVNAKSVDILMDNISSDIKECCMLDFDRHVIVRNERCELVFQAIVDFYRKHDLLPQLNQ